MKARLWAIIAAIIWCNGFSLAKAQLLVTPTRVVFEANSKAQTITLVNQAQTPMTYRINWYEVGMKKDGSYEELKNPRPDSLEAEKMLRYSPRQVALGAGETQVVRLSLRKEGNIPDGEYRTHMVFRADPTSLSNPNPNNNGISIDLAVAYGVSIPIVVRQGTLQAKAELEGAKIINNGKEKAVHLSINRSGNQSLYGDLMVTANIGGKETTLGLLRGVAVFLEVPTREVKIPLNMPAGSSIPSTANVRYIKPQSGSEPETILAETTIKG
ncbi:MAG: molecular chaperone [Alphaproteobacteria bacterium]